MNYLYYDLGLDPIEMGNTLAMLAEATDRGLVRDGVAWGNSARFEALATPAPAARTAAKRPPPNPLRSPLTRH